MTLPLLNQSRHVLFLVNAEKNPDLLQRVLAGDDEYPAAHVDPPNGQLAWMIGQRA
jgi:6-phosphogluconolactonase/glucosamine-6-phosphate isomerase/deaminase